jgi:hypothetical protein
MATVALRHSIFMHLIGVNSLEVTRAFAKTNAITYDYRYRIANPQDKEYIYNKNCRLYREGKKALSFAKVRGPIDSDLSDLKKEDIDKPKLAIIRDPLSWYKEYWMENYKNKWKSNSDNLYLKKSGDKNFQAWIDNMIEDNMETQEGFYSKYVKRFIGNDIEETHTSLIRHEYLAYDLHITLELLSENWRAAEYVKRHSLPQRGTGLDYSKEQSVKIEELDDWFYQFYV